MQLHQRGQDFGTLFSTAAAFTSPVHQRVTARALYDHVPALRLRSGPRQLVRTIVDAALAWHERARQRRALTQLNDRMLADIGLSRADVDGEVRKPFWRP